MTKTHLVQEFVFYAARISTTLCGRHKLGTLRIARKGARPTCVTCRKRQLQQRAEAQRERKLERARMARLKRQRDRAARFDDLKRRFRIARGIS